MLPDRADSAAGSGVSLVAGASLGQLLQMIAGERLGAAQLAGDQADVGEMLHRFHAHKGVLQRVAGGHHTVVGEQDRVMIDDQRLNAGGDIGRSSGRVRRQREWSRAP